MRTAVYDCIQPVNSIHATIKCEYAELLHAGFFFQGHFHYLNVVVLLSHPSLNCKPYFLISV